MVYVVNIIKLLFNNSMQSWKSHFLSVQNGQYKLLWNERVTPASKPGLNWWHISIEEISETVVLKKVTNPGSVVAQWPIFPGGVGVVLTTVHGEGVALSDFNIAHSIFFITLRWPIFDLTITTLSYTPWSPNVFFKFEIILNVSVSSFCVIWIPMVWVSAIDYKYVNYFSAGTVFIRQNLTSADVRFWRIMTVPALKGLMKIGLRRWPYSQLIMGQPLIIARDHLFK